jgi:(2Fe-2S) ferredoxin
MKLTWIRWAESIETRDDGFTIYHDLRFVLLRYPDGKLEKYITTEAAKRFVDSLEIKGQFIDTII